MIKVNFVRGSNLYINVLIAMSIKLIATYTFHCLAHELLFILFVYLLLVLSFSCVYIVNLIKCFFRKSPVGNKVLS